MSELLGVREFEVNDSEGSRELRWTFSTPITPDELATMR